MLQDTSVIICYTLNILLTIRFVMLETHEVIIMAIVGIITKCYTLNILLGIRFVMIGTHILIIMAIRRDHIKMFNIKSFTGYQTC